MKKLGILFVLPIFLTGCYSVDKGTTTIIPINVAKNGIFCGTKSITAARYIPGGYVIAQNNPEGTALKYTAENEDIYNKLQQHIGKPTVIEYTRDWFYFNPCIKDKYVIINVQ